MPVLLYEMQIQHHYRYRAGMRIEKGKYEMDTRIKVVIAVHPNSSRKFTFEVPDGMEVHKGNILLVETMKGKSIAICSSEEICIDVNDVEKLGAYLPLKKILQCAGEQIQDYIFGKCKSNIKKYIENYLDDGLPF